MEAFESQFERYGTSYFVPALLAGIKDEAQTALFKDPVRTAQ